MTAARLGGGTGVVADYDREVGLGTLEGDDGRSWPFHCTQIADGTRDIAVGTRVSFQAVAGHRGRWEAAAVRALR